MKKNKNKEEDMSQTFIAEVGQKSAIVDEDDIEEIKPKKEEKEEQEKNKKTKDTIDISNKPEKKSTNKVVLVILIILSLIIGAGGGYYFFNLKNAKETQTTPKAETKEKVKQEEFNPDGLFIKSLINRYDFSVISEVEIYNYLYSEDKISAKEIDKDYLRLVSASNIKNNLITGSFKSDELKDSITMLFGDKISLEDKNFEIGCTTYKYSNINKEYTREEKDGCGGATSLEMQRKIVKATLKTNKTLEVNVAVAIIDNDDDKVYKEYNEDEESHGEDELDNVDATSFDIDIDYKDLNQYKYTFNYDSENNNYYLVSIELIK